MGVYGSDGEGMYINKICSGIEVIEINLVFRWYLDVLCGVCRVEVVFVEIGSVWVRRR